MKFATGEKPGEQNAIVEPIPRVIPQQCVTLNFSMRTWEEIGPGKLYYLPVCQNPIYMMDKLMINQFNTFKGLWATMEIHKPKVRMSNFIMLQDDLRVQNNTPTDATAFTQVVYLVHYTPKNQSMYFALQNLQDDNFLTGPYLTYGLQPKNPNVSRLVEIDNFDNFERLLIKTANPGKTAGYDPNKNLIALPEDDFKIKSTYIKPGELDEDARKIAANLQPDISETTPYFIENGSQLLFARNLDKINFYKYGDVAEIDIETNLEGKKLMSENVNDFTQDINIERYYTAGSTLVTKTYATEWCWPGRNRPYYSRSTNLDINTFPDQLAKDLKPLKHHFFCMPPIKKPNGALLGQRCSVLLEQSFSVTLHFPTSIFAGENEEMEDTPMDEIPDQNSGIMLRRNVYGKPASDRPVEKNWYCGTGRIPSGCGLGGCPENSVQQWLNFINANIRDEDFEQMFNISDNPNEYKEEDVVRMTYNYVDDSFFVHSPNFKDAWVDMLDGKKMAVLITVTEGREVIQDNVKMWRLGEIVASGQYINYFQMPSRSSSMGNYRYLYLNVAHFVAIRNNLFSCVVPTLNEPKNSPIVEKRGKKRRRREDEEFAAGDDLVFNKNAHVFYS